MAFGTALNEVGDAGAWAPAGRLISQLPPARPRATPAASAVTIVVFLLILSPPCRRAPAFLLWGWSSGINARLSWLFVPQIPKAGSGPGAAIPLPRPPLAMCLRTWLVAPPDCCGPLALQPLGTNAFEHSQGDAYAGFFTQGHPGSTRP